jgi:hypothetical protein
MPITPGNPFRGRHYSGEVILLAVAVVHDIRWRMSMWVTVEDPEVLVEPYVFPPKTFRNLNRETPSAATSLAASCGCSVLTAN